MKRKGEKPGGLEIGNAWDNLYQKGERTNWIVGATDAIPRDSLRFLQQDNQEKGTEATRVINVAVKWFVHKPDDPSEWGNKKPTSKGKTISILAGDGEFELVFSKEGREFKLTLDKPGDFAIWGPGLEHSWKPLKVSTIVTVRWEPEE